MCESRQFVEACHELRETVERLTVDLNPRSLISELKQIGYGNREIDNIRDLNTIFSYGNQPYVVISAITRHLLEIGDMNADVHAEPFEGRHAPELHVPFVLMEEHHIDRQTNAVYLDIKSRLRLPFVNTDYRAFARWPSYFALAWKDLSSCLETSVYEPTCQACHNQVASLAAYDLPNPGELSSESLRYAAHADGNLDEVIQMCRLFNWLLPGLITNVAFFRHQLDAA